jgi:hypothetical protein
VRLISGVPKVLIAFSSTSTAREECGSRLPASALSDSKAEGRSSVARTTAAIQAATMTKRSQTIARAIR